MRTGLHCSVRRGMVTALEEAAALGCETLQIFTRAPRHWRSSRITDEEAAAFRERRKALALDPVIVHSPFLPNLCSSDERVYARTRRALAEDIAICQKIGAEYLVIHAGAYSPGATSAFAIERMMAVVNEGLSQAPGLTILIENMAGGGRRLGGTWDELARMLARAKDLNRLGICLDTAHAFGAGHPFADAAGVCETLGAIEQSFGIERIRVVHVNDSRAEPGSHLDLHQHLGKGAIGLDALRFLLSALAPFDPALILETPRASPESDRENLRVLRTLLPPKTDPI